MPREKLVRDKIPEIIRKSGEPCEIDVHYRKAHPEEMPELLLAKLREEVEEYAQNPSLDELADIMAVLIELSGEDPADLLRTGMRKERERGGFSQRFVLFMKE